jgi:hypothetical protein
VERGGWGTVGRRAFGCAGLWLWTGCALANNPYFDEKSTDGTGTSPTSGPTSSEAGTGQSNGSSSGTSNSATTLETTTDASDSASTGGVMEGMACNVDADCGGAFPVCGPNGCTGAIMCGTAEIMADAPVLYWRLGDEAGETALDASGNGLNGTYHAAALGVPGVSADGDTAITLSGDITSYVDLASFPAFPGEAFTVEFWARTLQSGPDEAFVSYGLAGVNDALLIDDPATLAVQITGISFVSMVGIADEQWHHVAVTRRASDGNTRVYLDGTELASTTGHAAGPPIGSGGVLVLGQDQDSLGGGFEQNQAFSGSLDELAIFDRVLGADRITAHMAGIGCTE